MAICDILTSTYVAGTEPPVRFRYESQEGDPIGPPQQRTRYQNAYRARFQIPSRGPMRQLLETLNGVEIYQGPCENCGMVTRIAFDGTRYLCVNCLKTLKSKPVRAQLDDVKAEKKREALDHRIRTLKNELSEAKI